MAKRFNTRTSLIVAALTLAACSQDATEPRRAAVVPLPIPGSATLEWQQQSRNLVTALRLTPPAAARLYAAVSVAQHRALQAVEETAGGGRAQLEARRGAVAGASVRVLSFFSPAAASSLEQLQNDQGNASPGDVHPHFTRGVAVGQLAGAAIVQHLQTDGFTAPWSGTAPSGPGIFTPLALPPAGVMLGSVKPHFLTSGSQFRSAPPPAFGSAAFTTDLNEVLTRAQNRTPQELALAFFWDNAVPSPTAIGLWNITAAGYVAENNLDEFEATRVFGLMHGAMFDAVIGCWDSKYFYWYIRPSQANSAIPLAFGLPNHPSYPSGHSCMSAAAARVLALFFPGHAAELNNSVADAGLSRILAGIHYRFDVTAGQALGRSVADWAIAHSGF